MIEMKCAVKWELMSDKPKEQHALLGDAAKLSIAEDAFGFDVIANAIAEVLTSRVAADGYAIGIDGKWGSGKTTLMNFVGEILESHHHPYHKVIRFQPWLIGDKKTLIRAFFDELSERIQSFRADRAFRCWTKLRITAVYGFTFYGRK